MIFVSSNIAPSNKIADQIRILANAGLSNIELTGGTDYYDGMVDDLKELKERFGLNYRLHNYFPPPKKHFVFNLASLDRAIADASIEHAKRAIDLSRQLESLKLAFHAGFFIPLGSEEIGKDISSRKLYDEEEAVNCFVGNLQSLQTFAGDEFQIYIENNVVSVRNLERFPERSPSMLNNYQDYIDLKKQVDFSLLLDVAHLKVSCRAQGLLFEEQLYKLVECTDYLHVSDNNAIEDQNLALRGDSELYRLLETRRFTGYDITLEVFDHVSEVKESHSVLKRIVGDGDA